MPDTALAHADLIHRFYTAFAAHDGTAMAACYHPQATFTDPVFGTLRGPEVPAMWHMLLARSQGQLAVTHSDVAATATTATARWEAKYIFSQTGRPVHNRIQAQFTFHDGLIHTHTDRFALWVWARQALGPTGLLLGWAPFFRAKLRGRVRAALAKFMAQHPAETNQRA